MHEQNKTILGVNILGKEYKIGCPSELQNSLLHAAKFLDHKMRELRDKHHIIGSDKIAVLAALHITHELLNNTSQNKQYNQEIKEKLSILNKKVTETITS